MDLNKIDVEAISFDETQSVDLAKGQNISLTKEIKEENLNVVGAGLGWNPVDANMNLDCDVSAILVGADGKAIPGGLVFFKKEISDDGAVLHSGDNLTGEGDGDDETILVELEELDSSVERIVFVVNIYDAEGRKQNFGIVDECYIRLFNAETGKVMMKAELNKEYTSETGLEIAELYKKNGQWKFKSIMKAIDNGTLANLVAPYGITNG